MENIFTMNTMKYIFILLGIISTFYYSLRSYQIYMKFTMKEINDNGRNFYKYFGAISIVWADFLASSVGWFSLYYFIKYFKQVNFLTVTYKQVSLLGTLFLIGFLGVTGHLKDILTEIRFIKDILSQTKK